MIAVVTLRDHPDRYTGWGEALSLGPWQAQPSGSQPDSEVPHGHHV
jgi:hypothetical protein